MEEAEEKKGPGGSTGSWSLEAYLQWCSKNLDCAPWARSLNDVAFGAEDLFDYISCHRTESGEEPPAVWEPALLMLRTGIDMLLWRYPEGSVAEALNPIGDLLDRLKKLMEDELSNLIEEAF